MVKSQLDKLGQYNQVGIQTSNQEALILKCYNGILACLRAAKTTIKEPKKRAETNKNMIKAQKGLALLADSVNNREGGEIGENLLKLYDFLIRYLVDANIKKDTDMIDEAIEMIDDMRASWVKAFEKMHEEGQTAASVRPAVRQNALNIVG